MKKVILILFMTVFLAGFVFAAQPNNQACLGKDISGYAQVGKVFGEFISGLASATTGVGSEFQAHLAGLIPDEIIPNSCND